MKLENMPRMDEADILDLRNVPFEKQPKPKITPIGSVNPDDSAADKRLTEEPSGDIGYEMQPSMRGYGKVEKGLKKWRVR